MTKTELVARLNELAIAAYKLAKADPETNKWRHIEQAAYSRAAQLAEQIDEPEGEK